MTLNAVRNRLDNMLKTGYNGRFANIINKKEKENEKNLSTQKKTEKQGTRIQKENVFHCRKKGIEEKKK